MEPRKESKMATKTTLAFNRPKSAFISAMYSCVKFLMKFNCSAKCFLTTKHYDMGLPTSVVISDTGGGAKTAMDNYEKLESTDKQSRGQLKKTWPKW